MIQPVIIECYSCADLVTGCCGDTATEMFKGIVVKDASTLDVLAKLNDGFLVKTGADYLTLMGVQNPDGVAHQYKLEVSNTVYADIAALKTAVSACKCPVGGGGAGGDTITSVTWTQVGNVLTVTTDAGVFPVAVTMNDGQVTTSAAITIGGTVYPIGTTVATILAALAGQAHPALTVTNNATPFAFDLATQVLNIPAYTKVDNGDGTETVTIGGVAITTQNGNTSTPHTVGATTFPAGTDIDIVLAAMITEITPQDFVEFTDAALVLGGGTTGTPTDAAAAAFIAAGSLLHTDVYYIGGGSALNPDYVWSVDGDGTVINTESPASGGMKRLVANNSVIRQDLGANATLVRSAGSGTVTIPDGTEISYLTMDVDAGNGDQGGDSSYTLNLAYAGTRTFNQLADLSDAEIPNIQLLVYNTATQVTTTTADAFEITRSAAGTLSIKFLNALQSAFDKRKILLSF